ncbi:MAG: cation-translocating P-type ATPase [Magnetovibrio sp.]|nr:cation-translocating P-type ATPase [Magnetovibrio sp.]
MDCTLCGLPTLTPPLESDGHAFCCFGCQEVYRNFGADVLFNEPTSLSSTDAALLPSGNYNEAFLRIEGMHCSSCEYLIERMAVKVNGIVSAASSYATSTAKIVYDPDIIQEDDLSNALKISGYKTRLSSEGMPEYDNRMDLLRLVVGLTFGGLVMMLYVAFFYPTHLGVIEKSDFDVIGWLAYSAAPWSIFGLTTVLIIYVAAPIFRGAWIGLRARMLNMDNLLAISILAAYGYSVSQLVEGSLDLYFDVAAAIILVVTIGRYVERGAKAEATQELMKIMQSWAPKARIRWGGDYRLQPIEELEPGEHVIIWEGEAIPVNGTIVAGSAAIDESLMTGEPFPVAREPGQEVLGGSCVVEGSLEIKVGPTVESQMDNLARILWNVQSSNAGAQGLADKVARVFVPLVMVLAVIVSGLTLAFGGDPRDALLAGLATLIVSCPCTFGLAIPLTTAVGVSAALRQGIIITSADAFEKAPKIDTIAIDKTGTLSTGDMSVVEVFGDDAITKHAAAVERLSPHPIAKAIARLDTSLQADELEIHPGKGAMAQVENHHVAVGSKALFATLGWDIPSTLAAQTATIAPGEGVVSYVGWDGITHGAIVTRDQSRPEWMQVVDRLRKNCRVVLLSGAEHPSGYEDHFDDVFAGVPPEGKAAVIRQLRQQGTVVMIGDGSNDAPALAAANLGIAFGAPTTLAAEAADVIIPGERLERIFDAFDLLDTMRCRIRQNLGWALMYNAVAIPLAITGLLNPLFAALAMSASSLMVVFNSSRKIKGPPSCAIN